MKKMLVFVALMAVVAIGQSVIAQDLVSVNKEIKVAQAEVKKAEKDFESQNARNIAEIKRDIRIQEIQGKRSQNAEAKDAAAAEIKKLKLELDSVSKLESGDFVQNELAYLKSCQDKRAELLKAGIQISGTSAPVALNIKKAITPVDAPKKAETQKVVKADDSKKSEAKEEIVEKEINRTVPVEVSRYNKNRRSRANVLRVDELVISKIEQNISSAISPGGQESGYKVIFDNMYMRPATYIVTSAGMARLAVTVEAKTRRTKFLMPGVYMVETYINGKKQELVNKLTIDGQVHDYKGESCFNFVYTPRGM